MSNKLRAKMKEAAEEQLDLLIIECGIAVNNVAKGTSVSASDLAAMTFQKRSKSMRNRSLSAMVNKAEDDLLKQYNQQIETPVE